MKKNFIANHIIAYQVVQQLFISAFLVTHVASLYSLLLSYENTIVDLLCMREAIKG